MAHLFSKIVIGEAIRNIEISDIEKKVALLKDWLDMYNSGNLQKKSEKEFEGVYSESLFGNILGYTSASSGEYTREKEPRNESNGQKCDIGLGFYTSENSITQAVVELKDAATSLDRPQQRSGNLTPVQQAFKYKPLYNSKWVIVSNFFEIRLYTDTYQDFESFTLRELVDEKNNYENFRKFHALFHASRLISKSGESETERLLAKVRIDQEVVSKKFYKEYSLLREELMRDIWKNNPELKNEGVITITQRIIDRIVFIHFCEDRGLLPENKLKENLERAREIDITPWEMLCRYFRGIDKGSEKLGIPNGYNGGLFHDEDDTINTLIVSDSIITKFIELGRYDFSDDGGELSVEILGHIFEQSISDLEAIREKIQNQGKENNETEKKVSKRKKDGIFYTPAYIVDYIVRNSLGKYLEEHEEALKVKYNLKADITEKNYRKRELEAYTEYQKILHNVKVLDPACGSGAFLVRVFDFLFEENKRVANILTGDGQANIFQSEEYFRDILRNNIYGVDLNEESVEITKLSLWLKSAQKGKKLVTLDNNIKCGNSLIDDPAVAGDKAFDWNTEFVDIMASGGFDVIVGNPPYGAKINKNDLNYFCRKYQYGGLNNVFSDTYISFYILGLSKLLNKNGILGYIAPNTWRLVGNGFDFRKFITSNKFSIKKIIQHTEKVFSDATVDVDSMIIKNVTSSGKIDILIGNLNKNYFEHSIDQLTLHDQDYINLFLSDSSYKLKNKIQKESQLIQELFDIKNGVKPYEVGKGKPQQTKEILDLKPYTSEIQIDTTFVPLIGGSFFNRYQLLWKNDYWIKYGQWLAAPRDKSIFDAKEKLIFRQTSDKITGMYIEDGYIMRDNTHILLSKPKSDLNLKYTLSLLNSELINYYYQLINPEKGEALAQVKLFHLAALPIKRIPLSEQQPFIDRADIMLTLNREFRDKSDTFLKNISAKYKIEKITRKLEKWWELDFADFVKELKVKISLEEQEELMSYFDKRKSEVRDIVAHIVATDREIDEMVFDLYGLTEEERKVVLNS